MQFASFKVKLQADEVLFLINRKEIHPLNPPNGGLYEIELKAPHLGGWGVISDKKNPLQKCKTIVNTVLQ